MNHVTDALVVHRDIESLEFITRALRESGYNVIPLDNGHDAHEDLRETEYDLVILSLYLPHSTDTMKLLRAIRWRWPDTATMIVTDSRDADPAIEAANEGVDSYVVMPVSAEELAQYAKEALGRRDLRCCAATEYKRRRWHDLVLELDRRRVSRHGEALDLTPSEFRLLRHLIDHAHTTVTCDELANAIRGAPVHSEEKARRLVRWHIHQLRQKIEPDPDDPSYIKTVTGVGYRLNGSERA